MLTVDTILLVIIGAFMLFGFILGFIHTMGALLGALLGVIITMRIIDPVMDAVTFLQGGGMVLKVITFVVLFLIVSRLVGLVFWLVKKAFHLFPFGKTIDRLLGGVLGFMEGVLITGAALFYGMTFVASEPVRAAVDKSEVAGFVTTAFGSVKFLIPESVRVLNEVGGLEELKKILAQGADRVRDLEALKNLSEQGIEKLKDLTDLEGLEVLKNR